MELQHITPAPRRTKGKLGHHRFLPENFAFYKFLTGPELLRFHMALAGIPGGKADNFIGELLAKVRLHGYEELRIGKYSRGMVQRLGLAQALMANAQLLVLDEPTSGLDPAGRKEVLDQFFLVAVFPCWGATLTCNSTTITSLFVRR